MNLRHELDQRLAGATAADFADNATWPFTIPLPTGGALEGELAGVESLACALWRLRATSPRLASLDATQLADLSRRLAGQLTYLLEPIRLVEVDGDAGYAQLRSQPPRREPDATSYYELLVTRDAIELRRYEKRRGASRQAVTAHVTREVLHRLATDLTSAAN